MKRALLLSVAMVCGLVTTGFAEGLPSKSKLSKLGLGSMEVASDDQGMEVRGAGYAAVGGVFQLGNFGPYPLGFGFFPATYAFPWTGGSGSTTPINVVSGQLLPATVVPGVATANLNGAFANAGSVNGVNFNYSTSGVLNIAVFGL